MSGLPGKVSVAVLLQGREDAHPVSAAHPREQGIRLLPKMAINSTLQVALT